MWKIGEESAANIVCFYSRTSCHTETSHEAAIANQCNFGAFLSEVIMRQRNCCQLSQQSTTSSYLATHVVSASPSAVSATFAVSPLLITEVFSDDYRSFVGSGALSPSRPCMSADITSIVALFQSHTHTHTHTHTHALFLFKGVCHSYSGPCSAVYSGYHNAVYDIACSVLKP